MLERVDYQCGMCLICALTLLIAVMTSPIRPSPTDSTLLHSISLKRNCSTPASESTRHCFTSSEHDSTADTGEFGQEMENEKVEECLVGVTGLVCFLIAPPLSTSLKGTARLSKVYCLMKSSPSLRC